MRLLKCFLPLFLCTPLVMMAKWERLDTGEATQIRDFRNGAGDLVGNLGDYYAVDVDAEQLVSVEAPDDSVYRHKRFGQQGAWFTIRETLYEWDRHEDFRKESIRNHWNRINENLPYRQRPSNFSVAPNWRKVRSGEYVHHWYRIENLEAIKQNDANDLRVHEVDTPEIPGYTFSWIRSLTDDGKYVIGIYESQGNDEEDRHHYPLLRYDKETRMLERVDRIKGDVLAVDTTPQGESIWVVISGQEANSDEIALYKMNDDSIEKRRILDGDDPIFKYFWAVHAFDEWMVVREREGYHIFDKRTENWSYHDEIPIGTTYSTSIPKWDDFLFITREQEMGYYDLSRQSYRKLPLAGRVSDVTFNAEEETILLIVNMHTYMRSRDLVEYSVFNSSTIGERVVDFSQANDTTYLITQTQVRALTGNGKSVEKMNIYDLELNEEMIESHPISEYTYHEGHHLFGFPGYFLRTEDFIEYEHIPYEGLVAGDIAAMEESPFQFLEYHNGYFWAGLSGQNDEAKKQIFYSPDGKDWHFFGIVEDAVFQSISDDGIIFYVLPPQGIIAFNTQTKSWNKFMLPGTGTSSRAKFAFDESPGQVVGREGEILVMPSDSQLGEVFLRYREESGWELFQLPDIGWKAQFIDISDRYYLAVWPEENNPRSVVFATTVNGERLEVMEGFRDRMEVIKQFGNTLYAGSRHGEMWKWKPASN